MFRWFIVIYSDDYLDTSGTCRFLQTSRSSISLTVKHHFPSTGWFEGKPIGSLGPWLNPEIELLFSFESMDGNHEEGYCGPFNGKNPCICCLCSKRTHAYIKWSSNVITKKTWRFSKKMGVTSSSHPFFQRISIINIKLLGYPRDEPWRCDSWNHPRTVHHWTRIPDIFFGTLIGTPRTWVDVNMSFW